jgi:hypothetical protein
MEDSLRVKLGIKPGNKVCLFHTRKDLLPSFMQGDLKLMLDWAEDGCDAILYWLQPGDNVKDIMTHLELQIKRTGRIWLIYKKEISAAGKKEKTGDDSIRRIVLETTNLTDNKTLAFGGGEYGTQYMFRKAARDEQNKSEDDED